MAIQLPISVSTFTIHGRPRPSGIGVPVLLDLSRNICHLAYDSREDVAVAGS